VADGMPLNPVRVMAVLGGATGDERRASMFIVGPLVGDSSRSRRDDNLCNGVACD